MSTLHETSFECAVQVAEVSGGTWDIRQINVNWGEPAVWTLLPPPRKEVRISSHLVLKWPARRESDAMRSMMNTSCFRSDRTLAHKLKTNHFPNFHPNPRPTGSIVERTESSA